MMKAAVAFLVLALALVSALQVADAKTCAKGLKLCGGAKGVCCPPGPPNSVVTCPKDSKGKLSCSWGCPADRYKCAGSCFKKPANSKSYSCSTRGEFTFKCDSLYKIGCNYSQCCFSPPGTIPICKPNGCEAGCKPGYFYCAAQCWKIPANCDIFCAVQGEARCNCKKGYKWGGSYLKCVKA